MKKSVITFLSVLFLSLSLSGRDAPAFDDFFWNKTLRIDYYQIGDSAEEIISIDKIFEQGVWAGSVKNVIDAFNNGRYYINVIDVASNKLIFSKGFNSYFGEYKTTDRAKAGKAKAYHETALIPCPKRPVLFIIKARDRDNILHPIFIEEIDPASNEIIREPPDSKDKVFKFLNNGPSHTKVDLTFVAEGYTIEDEEKFKKDLEKYALLLLEHEPYKSYSDRFNITGVFRPSSNRGVDEPRKGIYRNTALNGTFNSLNLERYLLTEDNRTLRDIASSTAYDFLIILVNSSRYGGGGIYNWYAILTTDCGAWEANLFYHEFGHSFAGLGDEYYSSETAYNEFYPAGVEPCVPNITALLNPDDIKWKEHLSKGIKIPTEWGKDRFDGLSKDYRVLTKEQKNRVSDLVNSDASIEEIKKIEKEFQKKLNEAGAKTNRFISSSPLVDKVGVFEGAGYSPKGMYRPMLNCAMHKFIKEHQPYCIVCRSAIIRMIDYYSD